jgi:CRP-like cAMP-binding protein
MAILTRNKIDSRQCVSVDYFKSLTLFNNLSQKDVMRFADAAQVKAYKKGHVLYLEGDQAETFYIVCTGWLKLFRTTEEGEEINLAVVTSDSIIGESAIFEEGHYTNSAQVAEDAQVVSIPIALLKDELRRNSTLAFNMLTCMARYQRRNELHLERYLLYSAPQRIGCFLLGLCPVPQQKDGIVLNLPYDKTLIASTLGMKGATFSRALKLLRDETGISIAGTRITIVSMERLLKFVDGCYSYAHHSKL